MTNQDSTITFWKNNEISGEHTKTIKEIINDFIGDESGEIPYLAGGLFIRVMAYFMATKYGYFEKLSDEQWDALLKAYWDIKGNK